MSENSLRKLASQIRNGITEPTGSRPIRTDELADALDEVANDFEQHLAYRDAFIEIIDGMVVRMAVTCQHHQLQGMHELITEFARLKAEANEEFSGIVEENRGASGL